MGFSPTTWFCRCVLSGSVGACVGGNVCSFLHGACVRVCVWCVDVWVVERWMDGYVGGWVWMYLCIYVYMYMCMCWVRMGRLDECGCCVCICVSVRALNTANMQWVCMQPSNNLSPTLAHALAQSHFRHPTRDSRLHDSLGWHTQPRPSSSLGPMGLPSLPTLPAKQHTHLQRQWLPLGLLRASHFLLRLFLLSGCHNLQRHTT